MEELGLWRDESQRGNVAVLAAVRIRPWTIAAPLGAAEYRQENLRLYYEGQLIYEGKEGEGQWDVTWQALVHFYGILARKIARDIPISD